MTERDGQPAEETERIRPSGPITHAAAVLSAAGIGPARAEAQLLAAYVLGVSRGGLALADGFTPAQLARFHELVGRRTGREPLQHLVGSAAFRYIELAVGPGVFVPRPETELLAGWGIAAAEAAERSEAGCPLRAVRLDPFVGHPASDRTPEAEPDGRVVVVDLCSGTGAIALAVANEVPSARVVAVERSEAALRWLRRNAADRVAAGDRPIRMVAADVTDPRLLDELVGRVDVLLCNPPYVPDGTAVAPEVAEHDPADAIFGGPDGLAVIRPVIARAGALLRPGGVLGIEHDDTHAEAVPALLRADGRFAEVADHQDLTGRPRFVTARRLATHVISG